MAPYVSVIIATLNRANLIRNAIDSVLAQTYRDFELIIADDGSTDDTGAVVGEYRKSSATPDQIRYFYQEHRGKSVALNHAIAMARGKWIAFLDSDDAWAPEKLEWQFRALAEYPDSGVCFTDCRFMNNPQMDVNVFQFFGREYSRISGEVDRPLRFLLESPCALIITLLCRADLVKKTGGFDPHLRFTEDYDFTFRLGMTTRFCFVNLPLAMADRSNTRHAGPSQVWDDIAFRLESEQYRYEKWLKLGKELPADIRRTIRERLRAVHSGWANLYIAGEDYPKARRAIAAAVHYGVTINLLGKWMLTSICPSVMKKLALARGFNTEHF